MQPIIETIARRSTCHRTPIITTREHIEAHREDGVFDAVRDACSKIGASTGGLAILERIVSTEQGHLADRLIAAFERIDHALRDGVNVSCTGNAVCLTVGPSGCCVRAEQCGCGWLVIGERLPMVGAPC